MGNNHSSRPIDFSEYSEDSITFSTKELVFSKILPKKSDTQQFEIISTINVKVKFKIEAVPPKGCSIIFTPHKGKLSSDRPTRIKAKFYLDEPLNADFKVTLNLAGGIYSKFFDISVRCTSGVFGCDPATLESVEDLGYPVPKVLVDMRHALELHNAHSAEGIFRLAGDVMDVKALKTLVNTTGLNPADVSDVHAVASLLKIWFRELPAPILNAIPPDVIKTAELESAINACNYLRETERNILFWLVDLLCEYVKNEKENKMTSQNLAIVVAPNLYNPICSNPLESMMLSQKSVAFLHVLLQHRINS